MHVLFPIKRGRSVERPSVPYGDVTAIRHPWYLLILVLRQTLVAAGARPSVAERFFGVVLPRGQELWAGWKKGAGWSSLPANGDLWARVQISAGKQFQLRILLPASSPLGAGRESRVVGEGGGQG